MPNDYDILRSIATGSSAKKIATPRQTYAKAQLDRARNTLDSIPSNITGKDRYLMWKRETRDWIPHPDNIEEMWELEDRAYPNGSFKQDSITKINNELEAMPSDTAKMDYYKKNASTWPEWLKKYYGSDIERSRTITENRALELSRINNKLATEDILNSFVSQENLYFNRAIAQRTHSEDIYNALSYGFTNEITTNSEGRVSVPLGGGLAPVYALNPDQFPSIDPREEYILLNDTFKMVDDTISPYYHKSESDYRLIDRRNKSLLFTKLDKLGNKFTDQHYNIILDYAEMQSDPAEAVNEGLGSVITKRIDSNEYNSSFETALDFVQKWQEVLGTLDKRSKKL